MNAASPPRRVAVVIPAKDESERIVTTIRSAKTIPGVDVVVVVDDASNDDTAAKAKGAGVLIERHSVNQGKGGAMETGAAAVTKYEAIELMTSGPDHTPPPRALLFIDADLTDTAAECAPLVEPVLDGSLDMAIALLPPQERGGGKGRVVRTARAGIKLATGFEPVQPLAGMRCMTREAFEAALPLAKGWGVETGMTIDVLNAGFRAGEIPCDLRHRVSPATFAGAVHRGKQLRDVLRAMRSRGILADMVKSEIKSRRAG